MARKPRIVLVFTGGTISMRKDSFGGVVPALSSAEILAHSPNLYDKADLEVCEFGHYPGPHITPAIMHTLSGLVQGYAERPDVDGVVITHGTDTLEETAYFLDCTLKTEKPVVIVGSMRNSSEADWDGPRNLRDGITIAAHPAARGRGVMVCLAETINAAGEVSKVDTSNLNTFESLNFGPLGRIVNESVQFFRHPIRRDYFRLQSLPRFVPIIKVYTGDEAVLLQCAIEHEAAGIVVEAMGVGNVPPVVYNQILRAVGAAIPVVLVSRCPIGRVEHIYAYEGAGRELYKAGVIFADYLNGQKARIKLMAALGAGYTVENIRECFEWSE